MNAWEPNAGPLERAAAGTSGTSLLARAARGADVPSKVWLHELDFTVAFLDAHARLLEGIAAVAAEVADSGGDGDDVEAAIFEASGYFGCLEKLLVARFRREFSQLAWELERDEVPS